MCEDTRFGNPTVRSIRHSLGKSAGKMKFPQLTIFKLIYTNSRMRNSNLMFILRLEWVLSLKPAFLANWKNLLYLWALLCIRNLDKIQWLMLGLISPSKMPHFPVSTFVVTPPYFRAATGRLILSFFMKTAISYILELNTVDSTFSSKI